MRYLNKTSKIEYLICFAIAIMATSFAPFVYENRLNLLLVGMMSLSPIVLLRYQPFYKFDIPVLLLIVSMIFCSCLHLETFRFSTLIYAILFCITFIAYLRLLHNSAFTAERYLKVLKWLLYAYCIVLIVQHICVLLNLPVFNKIGGVFDNKFKVNSLSFEPSHSARIIALLMFCYISIKELTISTRYSLKIAYKSDRYVWLAFLYAMIMTGAATAFLFLPLVLLKFMRLKNLLPLFVVGIVIMMLIQQSSSNEASERMYKTGLATLTLDESYIIETDHSAAFRVVPVIANIKMMDISEIDFWFGHGIDYIKLSFDDIIPNADESTRGGGGIFGFIIEYGMIPFIIFMVVVVENCFRKKDYLGFIFCFFLVFLGGITNYMSWLTLILLATNKFLYNKCQKYRTNKISNNIQYEKFKCINVRI